MYSTDMPHNLKTIETHVHSKENETATNFSNLFWVQF